MFFFFFSSRRRHTRFDCDWSSDVCSSDLRAESGRPGAGARKSGKAGADLRLPVPVGTVVVDEETGAVVADLEAPGAEAVVARGGARGGGDSPLPRPPPPGPPGGAPGAPGAERGAAPG